MPTRNNYLTPVITAVAIVVMALITAAIVANSGNTQSSTAQAVTGSAPNVASATEVVYSTPSTYLRAVQDVGAIAPSAAVGQQVFVDLSPLRVYAEANGFTGSSPTSVAPATEALNSTATAHFLAINDVGASAPSAAVDKQLFVDLTPLRAYAEANGLTGSSPTSVTPTTNAVDSTATAHFLAINDVDTNAPSAAVSQQSSLTLDTEWLQTNGWLVTPSVAQTSGPSIAPRSNFASDIDWLEANGW